MPYSKSQARKNFETEIDKMISVIKAAYKNKGATADIKEYVLSCATLLASAKLEVYFEDFFDTWIQKVNLAGLNVSHLPKNLRAVYLNQGFLNNAFKKLIIENNESNFIDVVTAQMSNYHFHLTDDIKPLPSLNSKRIYQNRKYPSPDNVKAMFKRVGFNNIFNELNRNARADIESLLQSFNDFRTTIAHNGIPAGINDRDVIEKLADLKDIVYYMDKELFKHINRHTTNATWTV
jgi:hypothetical protein